MASKSFATAIASFLMRLDPPALPAGVEVLNPYLEPEIRRVVRCMTSKFYVDTPARLSVWGINPGRFGAGLTGLAFTDPWAVVHQLGISTSITGRREISAAFISDVIDAYGGPAEFYRDIYLGAVSPHGYVRDGVNMNFYDTPELRASVVPYAVTCMQKQIKAGLRTDVAVVLGSGALRKVVEREIRSAVGLEHVVYLEHPRFVMQYRRSQRGAYVDRYVSTFRSLFTP